jgi:hypothetical protein
LERRKFRKGLRFFVGITYRGGSVALESAVMDLHNGIGASINGSALKVACGAPGHGRKIRKILETSTPLT